MLDLVSAAPAQVRVPAKINLFLAVRGVRPDGYHEVVSVLQTVSIHDHLHAHIDGPPGRAHHPASRRRMAVELRAAGAGLPPPAANLATHAAWALGRRVGLGELRAPLAGDNLRTVLTLHKRIPVAGGMAGGSADAAAALVALNQVWRCDLSRDDLREIAAELGSDVPFCVVGGTALATGRGAAVAQVLCRGTFTWVVGTSHRPLLTADVYRAWDRWCEPSEVEPDAVLAALRNEDPEALGAALYNDLEPAAFALRPELAEAKSAMLDAGALGAALSGSGPTMLALCRDSSSAAALADRVRERFADVLIAQSPAGGPELINR